jgi:DNA-binding Lrp family transcriptional regulator
MTLDALDHQLLHLVQQDAEMSHASLAESVGLSVTGVHKRLKRLRQEGVIKKVVAVLDRNKLGFDLTCFLKVKFKNNLTGPNLPKLRKAIKGLPEVLECYTLTGTDDAILKITVPDHVALREFLTRFSESQNVIERVETCIVLEEIKEGAPLPI